MRPSTLPNVFALGDAVDLGDGMTIVAVSRQVPWLARTLRAMVAGQRLEDQKPYAPWTKGKTPILIPLGPRVGASFLVLFKVGNLMTGLLKGKSLLLGKYRKLLGQT